MKTNFFLEIIKVRLSAQRQLVYIFKVSFYLKTGKVNGQLSIYVCINSEVIIFNLINNNNNKKQRGNDLSDIQILITIT